ncbi:MAG: hypothetical protein ACOCXA_01690 [Planctomycetota bacterium]
MVLFLLCVMSCLQAAVPEPVLSALPPLVSTGDRLPAGASTHARPLQQGDGRLVLAASNRWCLDDRRLWLLPPGQLVVERGQDSHWRLRGWRSHSGTRLLPMAGLAEIDPAADHVRLTLSIDWNGRAHGVLPGHYRLVELLPDRAFPYWVAPRLAYEATACELDDEQKRIARNLFGLEHSLPLDRPESRWPDGRIVPGWPIWERGSAVITGHARLQSGEVHGSLVELHNRGDDWLYTDLGGIHLPGLDGILLAPERPAFLSYMLALPPGGRVHMVLMQRWHVMSR